jgi:hypothetical protein
MKMKRCLAFAAAILFSGTAYGETMTVGTGSAQFNGLLQFWALNDSTTHTFNYRLRRGELRFSGSLMEKADWFLMVDPSKSLRTGAISAANDNKILQDFGIAYKVYENLELTVGQFKGPTTAEGLDSSTRLLFPERSYTSRAFGDRREPGVRLSYGGKGWKAAVMSSNGQGANVDDVDNRKDLHARVEADVGSMVKVGAFTTAGNSRYRDRRRFGSNIRLTAGKFLAQLEGVQARDLGISSTAWTGDLGYSIDDRWQPVLRYDTINRIGAVNSRATACLLGLNYGLERHHLRFQAAGGRLRNMSSTNGSYAPSAGKDGNVFVLSFQAAI